MNISDVHLFCWRYLAIVCMYRGNLWEEFGVKRASLKIGGDLELEALPSAFRAGNDADVQRIRSLHKASAHLLVFKLSFQHVVVPWMPVGCSFSQCITVV